MLIFEGNKKICVSLCVRDREVYKRAFNFIGDRGAVRLQSGRRSLGTSGSSGRASPLGLSSPPGHPVTCGLQRPTLPQNILLPKQGCSFPPGSRSSQRVRRGGSRALTTILGSITTPLSWPTILTTPLGSLPSMQTGKAPAGPPRTVFGKDTGPSAHLLLEGLCGPRELPPHVEGPGFLRRVLSPETPNQTPSA